MLSFDVTVVGGSTTGAYAAYQLAKKGFSVAIVEAKELDQTGPTWANAIPSWMFDYCDLSQPQFPMLLGETQPTFYIRNSNNKGPLHFQVPLLTIDMRVLAKHLQKLCLEVGVTFFNSSVVEAVEFDKDSRLKSIEMRSVLNNDKAKIYSKLFVDASGLKGALRSLVPTINEKCPYPHPDHICSAAQVVFKLKDAELAKKFLVENGYDKSSIFSQVGLHGAYSTLTIEISFEHQTVGILCGNISDGKRIDVWKWVDEVAGSFSWVGEKLFGGRGAIPIERPYDEFAFPGLVLLGNTGRMVFPAHGSGVGSGMIAGKILAESLKQNTDPGSTSNILHFQQRFMREIGATHAAYDFFRQFTQSLTTVELNALLESDFMMPSAVEATMMQKILHPSKTEIARAFKATKKYPALGKKILPVLVKMRLVYELYRKYPLQRGRAFKAWQKINATFWNLDNR